MIVVTGARGHVGRFVVRELEARHLAHRAIDLPEFDLSSRREAAAAVAQADAVIHLAAAMGGVAYTSSNHAEIAAANARIDMNVIGAARVAGAKRFVYASSFCVYPRRLTRAADGPKLREVDAWPADPEPGYGAAKLFGEELTRYHFDDRSWCTPRISSAYGPECSTDPLRAKFVAALCAKVARVADAGTIEVWGDGSAVRNLVYVEDCARAFVDLAAADFCGPVNLAGDEDVSVAGLLEYIARAAGKRVRFDFDPSKPIGAVALRADNTFARATIGFRPLVSALEGVRRTYDWIRAEQDRHG